MYTVGTESVEVVTFDHVCKLTFTVICITDMDCSKKRNPGPSDHLWVHRRKLIESLFAFTTRSLLVAQKKKCIEGVEI